MSVDLMTFVLDKLPRERAQLEAIATRSKVPIHTLVKIVSGETKNPRVKTAQALYNVLAAQELAKKRRAPGACA